MKRKGIACLLFVIIFMCFAFGNLTASPDKLVYVIPIDDTIDAGLAGFVERGYREAEENGAELVVLEIDTPGGVVEAAVDIRDTIINSLVPSSAYVKGRAISAGTLITVACKTIAMKPGSTIGAAEPRIGLEKADEKYVSYFAQEMVSTAEIYGRDPEIAAAMVDSDRVVPGLSEKGKLLTMSYKKAEEYGYADHIVNSREELLTLLDLGEAEVVQATPTVSEGLIRLVTNPYIAPLLLTLGIAGVVIEVFTMGFGIPGILGIAFLSLYFGGHLLAGFTSWGIILLFLLGIILLGVEVIVPGFGLPGISGITCMVVSIVLAAPSWEAGLVSLVLAIVGTIILLLLSFKILKRRNLLQRLVLGLKYDKQSGYVPGSKDLSVYIGALGVAYTVLRPAGGMLLEDGTRLDVVTNGEYINKNEKVKVVNVEGMRVIVERISET